MTVINLNDKQLGDLLVEAQLVTSDMVEIALQISAGFGESLGQVLVDTKRISESDLHNVVLAQKMVMAGLDKQAAAKALSFANKTRVAFDDAIARLFPTETVAQAA